MTTVDVSGLGEPAIRVMMMPRDTNAHGTIFGGVLLSYIDQAGAIEARRVSGRRVVTVAMDAVEFRQPVLVGDLVSFYTRTLKTGRTSIRVAIIVAADRFQKPGERIHVTQAEAVYVAIDEQGRPVPVDGPRE